MKNLIRKILNILPLKPYLFLSYFYKHKRFLSLSNAQSLNEKIQYLKLYGYEPLHKIVADKYKVREYVENKIGQSYLIPLLASSKLPDSILMKNLPNSFVMKANHSSGQVKVIHDKNNEDIEELIDTCKAWLSEDYYSFSKEPQYKNIERRIIFEKLIADEAGNLPFDYKFHCFNGHVEFIQVDVDRFSNHKRCFYNRNWERLPFNWSPWKNGKEKFPLSEDIHAPKNINEMIVIAEKLASEFNYVRIDLYNCNEKIYFGEITLHHGSGWERFTPLKYDKYYGEKLNISSSL